MGVISVRIPDDLQRELERADVKVPAVVKRDLLALARDLQLKRKMATLAKYRTKARVPVSEIVRQARDEP